jgi:hypothetical protein
MSSRNVALLILIFPLLTGCASIASSIVESATSDPAVCHNKCPGGSPKEEKECREKCMAELRAKREEAEAKIKAWEWEETKRKQIKVMNKQQRGILE